MNTVDDMMQKIRYHKMEKDVGQLCLDNECGFEFLECSADMFHFEGDNLYMTLLGEDHLIVGTQSEDSTMSEFATTMIDIVEHNRHGRVVIIKCGDAYNLHLIYNQGYNMKDREIQSQLEELVFREFLKCSGINTMGRLRSAISRMYDRSNQNIEKAVRLGYLMK